MRPWNQRTVSLSGGGLRAIQLLVAIGKALEAVGKCEGRRTPVVRVLIIARDAEIAGDIHAIVEERIGGLGVAAEVESERVDDARIEVVRPIHTGIHRALMRRRDEAEEVVASCRWPAGRRNSR